MGKMIQKVKEFIKSHPNVKDRALAVLIEKELNEKVSHMSVHRYRQKLKKEEIVTEIGQDDQIVTEIVTSQIDLQKSIEPDIPQIVPEPKKYLIENGKAQTRLINKGDLINLVVDAIKGKIPIDEQERIRLKKGCGKKPFGGIAKGSGGWNSILYAMIDIIEKSERVFVLKY